MQFISGDQQLTDLIPKMRDLQTNGNMISHLKHTFLMFEPFTRMAMVTKRGQSVILIRNQRRGQLHLDHLC